MKSMIEYKKIINPQKYYKNIYDMSIKEIESKSVICKNTDELPLNQLAIIKENRAINLYYAIDDESKFEECLLKISKYTEGLKTTLHCQYKKQINFKGKSYNPLGYVNIYQNKNTDNKNRIVKNGDNDYECIFWVKILR